MTKTLTKATELDELREYAREATKAITGLTAGGSEYFGKRIGDIYTADLPFCVGRIRERFEREADWTRKSMSARKSAEAKLAALVAALLEARATMLSPAGAYEPVINKIDAAIALAECRASLPTET